MLKRVKSIRWYVWMALGLGLAAGHLCRSETYPPLSEVPTKEKGRNHASPRDIVPPKGPTAVYLEEINGISAARCEELFREMAGPCGSRDPVLLQGLFSRWLTLEDPQLVLARLGPEAEFPERIWAAPFFEAWAAMDYQGAFAKAGAGKFSSIRAIVAMRHHDPALLKESLHFWDGKDSPLAKQLTALGRENPALAQEIAGYKEKPDDCIEQILAVTQGWASQDPEEALAWIQRLELSQKNQVEALKFIFTEWVKSDPSMAKRSLESTDLNEQLKKSLNSNDVSFGILFQPEKATSQLFHSLQSDPFIDLAGIHRKLAQSPVDWNKATFFIPPIDRDGWFSTDPAKSAEEATRLPPGKARDFLMFYICAQWADRDPSGALAYAKTHGLKPPYVSNEPTPEMTRAALAAPEETFAKLLQTRQSDSAEHQVLEKMAETWFSTSPQEASEWLLAQPEATDANPDVEVSIRVELSNHIGYLWAKKDAVGAGDWLENLPDGPQKQVACRAMFHDLGNYSPDLAFTLTASILNGEQRPGYLGSGITLVAQKIGTPAARELLRVSALSAAEQETLNRMLDNLPAKKH